MAIDIMLTGLLTNKLVLGSQAGTSSEPASFNFGSTLGHCATRL